MPVAAPRRLLRYTGLAFAFLVAMGVFLYYVLYVLKPLAGQLTTAVAIIAAIVLGYAVVAFLAREIRVILLRTIRRSHAYTISAAFRFVGYMVIALAVVVLLGPSGETLLAGGTFAGLVLGLAATTVLGNVFGGLLLVAARPFHVGERVTVATVQYNVVMPAYFPKFYNDDRLVVGFTGTVTDIALTYTVLALDEGTTVKIPNSVMVQAAILSHPPTRWVRVRYEVAGDLDPERLIAAVEGAVQRNPWVLEPDKVKVLVQVLTPTSTVLTIDALCKSDFEDPPRSSLLIDASKAVQALRAKPT